MYKWQQSVWKINFTVSLTKSTLLDGVWITCCKCYTRQAYNGFWNKMLKVYFSNPEWRKDKLIFYLSQVNLRSMVNNCVLFMLYTINEESCKILYFRFEQESDTVLTFSFSLLLFMYFSFTYYLVFVVQYKSSYLFNYVIKQNK